MSLPWCSNHSTLCWELLEHIPFWETTVWPLQLLVMSNLTPSQDCVLVSLGVPGAAAFFSSFTAGGGGWTCHPTVFHGGLPFSFSLTSDNSCCSSSIGKCSLYPFVVSKSYCVSSLVRCFYPIQRNWCLLINWRWIKFARKRGWVSGIKTTLKFCR